MKKIALILIASFFTSALFAQQRKKVNYRLEFQKAADDRITNIGRAQGAVYHIHVRPGDKVFNGNRAEIAVKFNNLNGHTYLYSWDFNIDGKYPQHSLKFYHFIIAQWWNGPAAGQSMDAIKGIQGPPLYFVVVKIGERLHLQVYYGLQGKNREKALDFIVDTDKWFHVTNEVHWSTGNDGFANITVGDKTAALKGPNKYNTQPTDFKVGLYRNMDNADDTQITIKNISVNEDANNN